MKIGRLGDWLGLLFFVAILFMLLRPQSKAVELIEGFSKMLVALVKSATDMVTP